MTAGLVTIDRAAQVARLRDFSEVWDALARCRDRGVHIFDDNTRVMVYRSYRDVLDEAGRLAATLARYGVGRGHHVLLCAATHPNFPSLWLALVWLGATPVPVPPRAALVGQYTFRERLRGIIRYFPFYLCADDERVEILEITAETAATTRIVALDELYRDSVTPLQFPERVSPAEQDVAFVQFTSGSTKAPKGILVTYGNLFANVYDIWSRLQTDPDAERFISWLPLYHDMGLVGKFLGCLLTQTELVLMSPQAFAKRPLNFLSMIGEYRASVCSMPNFALEWILRRMSASVDQNYSLESMKWIGVGAEPVNPATLERFELTLRAHGLREGTLSPCYGLAEATLGVSISPPGEGYDLFEHDGRHYPTVGRLLTGMEVRVSPQEGHPAFGRILIRGESVARRALIGEEVVNLLDQDGYYDTKDIGGFAGSHLVVLGRADEMFIVNGENYFPSDIESVVRTVASVLRNRVVCFCVASGSRRAGEIVILYESRPLSLAEEDKLNSEIERQVRGHMGLPAVTIQGVPPKTIPVTPSGKIQRLRARQLYQEGFYHTSETECV